jgi:hypothetical protein
MFLQSFLYNCNIYVLLCVVPKAMFRDCCKTKPCKKCGFFDFLVVIDDCELVNFFHVECFSYIDKKNLKIFGTSCKT